MNERGMATDAEIEGALYLLRRSLDIPEWPWPKEYRLDITGAVGNAAHVIDATKTRLTLAERERDEARRKLEDAKICVKELGARLDWYSDEFGPIPDATVAKIKEAIGG